MSSILDALRKLEQEKSTREQPTGTTSIRELAFEPELELGGEGGQRTSAAKMAFMIVGGGLVTLGIGAGVVAAAMMVTRHDAPVHQVAASAPSQTPAVTTVVKPVEVAALDDETELDAAETEPMKVASTTPRKQASAEKPVIAPKPAPAPKAAAAVAKPAPPVQPPKETADAEPAKASVETDMEKQPILSEAVRVRLGLPPLKINIVGIPNERNPRASALINMQKVYVGENIPGTSARLMDVSLRGVSVDINGQRYFLSRR